MSQRPARRRQSSPNSVPCGSHPTHRQMRDAVDDRSATGRLRRLRPRPAFGVTFQSVSRPEGVRRPGDDTQTGSSPGVATAVRPSSRHAATGPGPRRPALTDGSAQRADPFLRRVVAIASTPKPTSTNAMASVVELLLPTLASRAPVGIPVGGDPTGRGAWTASTENSAVKREHTGESVVPHPGRSASCGGDDEPNGTHLRRPSSRSTSSKIAMSPSSCSTTVMAPS